MKRTHVVMGCAALLVALPIAAYALIKPLRVAVPALVPGVSCAHAPICIDDASKLADAQQLYRDGYARAAAAVGAFGDAPRVVFCSTRACADAFGLGERAALTLGTGGVVIAPRGWHAYFVAHELIHHRQAETLGNLAVLTKPRWLIEGMAYSLSGDPRHPLKEPFEGWRAPRPTTAAYPAPHARRRSARGGVVPWAAPL
ncbi:hypothetical protein, partial [Burkholderia multivorans]|uniref:hypothetical protein n=2 Tax=Burkholderia multivorans TaxID=87883 RepID=UPI0021AC8A62